jgi:A/G-specific adenine glycosylase
VLATALTDPASFRAAALGWYGRHGRTLNFRRRRDPYAVLVSEAMAQQTQISRVEPAWEAFLAQFPSVRDLAAASTADVLRAWAGMGYNRRALNLQRAARTIVEVWGGQFPETVEGIQSLPGVGPYTARAVAAIAFGLPVGAVDTNVRRVLGRVAGGWNGLPKSELQALADDLVPAGRAGEWTHALMDIGARFCRPRSPICGDCPVGRWCMAAAMPMPTALPTGARSKRRPGPGTPFRESSRWLRGRLIDRARTAQGDEWVRFGEPIEPHDGQTVAAAVRTLAAEGLLELHESDATLARLAR